MTWYSENWTDGVRFSIRVRKHLHHEQTPYQKIDFYDSYDMGRFFTLDGLMMVCEKDEWIYHDMITHLPMAVNPEIKRVLIIGGGDGGTVRELVRYRTIESIDLVEIDRRVVELSQQFLPELTKGLSDPRVSLYFEDGVEFVDKTESGIYDLILIDSTDPIGPGEGLFTRAFYQNCYRIMTREGILINQHESPYFPNYASHMQKLHHKMKQLFPQVMIYHFHLPSYPSGFWLFGFASKHFHALRDHQPERWENFGLHTRYYNQDVHKSAFAHPTFLKEQLRNV
jgi:spermidine synthase